MWGESSTNFVKQSNVPATSSVLNGSQREVVSWLPSAVLLLPKTVLCVLILAVIITGISIVLLTVDRISDNENLPFKKIHFSVLFDQNVRKVFKHQREDSMRAMLYGVRAALGSHCERPPVLMFIAKENGYATAQAIAKRLIQAYLIAQGTEVEGNNLRKVVLKGSKFQALDNYWDFFRGLSKRLAHLRVAIVSEFQCLHPQIASILCHLADDAFSPYPKTIILLLVDMKNHFTERELKTRTPVEIAESFTNHIMTGFLDRNVVVDLQRTICGRPAYIEPEDQLEML